MAAAVGAPGWARSAGLDVWDLAGEREQLRDAVEECAGLDAAAGRQFQRAAVTRDILARLCAGRLTPEEARVEVLALADASPGWLESVRATLHDRVPTGAADGEVAACFLRVRLEALCGESERAGDTGRAAAVAALRERVAAELAR